LTNIYMILLMVFIISYLLNSKVRIPHPWLMLQKVIQIKLCITD
jgi:hypothetical protein